MTDFDGLTWDEAMRRGHAAVIASEGLYDESNALEGRSNIDIEEHLRDRASKPLRRKCGSRWPGSSAPR